MPKQRAAPAHSFYQESSDSPRERSEPLRLAFGLMNREDADGTVTIKDRTYSFTTDSSQERFKVSESPPEDIRVTAIPDAVYEGELRFDLRLPPEKLAALRSGKSRLFLLCEW